MPTFPTPGPVDLRVRIGEGEVTVVAAERADTEVEVSPANPASQADVELAEATRVEHSDDAVIVEAPEHRHSWLLGRSAAIVVRVGVPEGSSARIAVSSADVRGRGRLGAVEAKSASGDVEIDHAATLSVQTASGDIVVREADGDARLATASGDISLFDASGSAQLSTASGDVYVGHAFGDVGVKAASGDISIDAADASVTVKSASGDAELRRVRSGTVTLETASGDVGVGIAAGTAAWLDVQSLTGDVRSSLDDADGPVEGGETVRVRARTISGDIAITRAS
jgi:DUF4097 and DUF4098 domain-containing protein YvlB